MKILFGCSELGLGHVSRAKLLGRELIDRGHETSFLAASPAYGLLKGEFKKVYPCTSVKWYDSADGIRIVPSILNTLLPLPWYNKQGELEIRKPLSVKSINRYYDERRYMKVDPDVIVSDGSLGTLRLAERWEVPSIFITNIIRPKYPFPKNLLLAGPQRFIEGYIKECDKIVIPDLPPEHTICEYNLKNLDRVGIKDKVEFVGSFFDTSREQGSEEVIYASISGPYGTRAKMIKEVTPVLPRMKRRSVISLGEPRSGFRKNFGRCKIRGWLEEAERKHYMGNSKLVIFSGGHGTCFETLKYGKPSICIPTQPEQRGNSRKLEELGCSISIESGSELESAIKKIEQNGSYKRNAERLGNYAANFDGLTKTVEMIEDTY